MASASSKHHNVESMLQDFNAEPRDLPLHLLKGITNDFSDEREIGRGGFGVVYKGVHENGEIIAVKKLVSRPGFNDRQFENEVYNLMMLKHQNIVRFVGYCYEIRNICVKYEGKYCFAEIPERLLCLEYLPNGSLERHISDESCGLDWHKRYKIIEGVSCGLHYLHEECQVNTPIVHLDLKPANILLTNEMVPKIADFGLSRLFGERQSRIYTTIMEGSLGYMAPEYLHKGIITKKADIFSLGVIFIEIITGLREYPESTGTSTQDFVERVVGKWRNRLEEMSYTSLEKYCKQIKRCLEIGLNCVQTDVTRRPTTKEIIESLNACTILHVSNLESSLADQAHGLFWKVEEYPSNLSKATHIDTSPEKEHQHKRRCLDIDLNCLETDSMERPANKKLNDQLNEDTRKDADESGDNGKNTKKMKVMEKRKHQVKVRVRSASCLNPVDDGHSWRKYGQEEISGAKHPRGYYRCTHIHSQGCLATKQVQRTDEDPTLFDVIYLGEHTCVQSPTAAAAAMKTEWLPTLAADQEAQDEFQEVMSALVTASAPPAPDVDFLDELLSIDIESFFA